MHELLSVYVERGEGDGVNYLTAAGPGGALCWSSPWLCSRAVPVAGGGRREAVTVRISALPARTRLAPGSALF